MSKSSERTVVDWWSRHDEACLLEMDERVRRVAQMSFYAGAEAMLTMWQEMVTSNMSAAACTAIVESWRQEGRDFARALAIRQGMPESAVADMFGRGTVKKRTVI